MLLFYISWWRIMLPNFSFAYWLFLYFFLKNVYLDHLFILNWRIRFFKNYLAVIVLYVFKIQTPSQVYDLKIYSLKFCALFHFLNGISCITKIFNFDEIKLAYLFFSFVTYTHGVISKKVCLNQGHRELLLYFFPRVLLFYLCLNIKSSDP